AKAQPDRTAAVRDPYARWCGRGGVVRRPPIPINDPLLTLNVQSRCDATLLSSTTRKSIAVAVKRPPEKPACRLRLVSRPDKRALCDHRRRGIGPSPTVFCWPQYSRALA